jgi:hypothetical protein
MYGINKEEVTGSMMYWAYFVYEDTGQKQM